MTGLRKKVFPEHHHVSEHSLGSHSIMLRSPSYKDHIEKIDFQELSFAVVNWPNSELYGAFVCIICYIG